MAIFQQNMAFGTLHLLGIHPKFVKIFYSLVDTFSSLLENIFLLCQIHFLVCSKHIQVWLQLAAKCPNVAADLSSGSSAMAGN